MIALYLYHDLFGSDCFSPFLQLQETGNELILHAHTPGMKQADLDITIAENLLILKGKTGQDQTFEEHGLKEQRYNGFCWAIPIPGQIKSEQVIAKYSNEVLELRMPKMARQSLYGRNLNRA